MTEPRPVVPLRIDLSAMVRRSVATLYSHLVTRPTGQALRLGIESQIGEVGTPCVSILDFGQVVIMDYSCADEAVAKLLQRYLRQDGPEDVYFLARGIGERHLETIDAVLSRHRLALVVELEDAQVALLGPVTDLEHEVWRVVEECARRRAEQVAAALAISVPQAGATLATLAGRRLVARQRGDAQTFVALTALVPPPSD